MLLNYFLKILGDSILWKVLILFASIKIFISNIPTVPDSALVNAQANEAELKELITASEELKESLEQISMDTLFVYIEASFHRYWMGDKPAYYYCSTKNKHHFYSENETNAISFDYNGKEMVWINDYQNSISNTDTLLTLNTFFNLKESFMIFTRYSCNPFLRYRSYNNNSIVNKYIIMYYKRNHYVLVKAPNTRRIEYKQWIENQFEKTIQENSEMRLFQDWTIYCFKNNTYFLRTIGYGE